MAAFQCPAGHYCSEPMKSLSGVTADGDPIYTTHITATQLDRDGDGTITGGNTSVYINPSKQVGGIVTNDDVWTKVSSTTNGQRYLTSLSTISMNAHIPQGLANNKGVLYANVNQQTVATLTKAGVLGTSLQTLGYNQNKAVVDPPNIPIGRNNPFDEVVSPDTPLSGNSVPDAITPRKNFGKDHIYPLDLGSTDQDILKIDMVEYTAAGLDYTGEGREQAGEGNREIIGTVILPIPSGIRDYNNVDWGSNSLNTMEMAAAKIAMATIEDGHEGLMGAVRNAIDHSQGTSTKQNARDALKSLFTAAAIGKDFKNMIGRAEGAIMNPNMELLFNNPVLRPFEFTFLLAPRTSDESKAIARIIRFFKQGMAAKRTEGNLFLKSPNTFQLTYKHRGSKGDDHPYLNKFKECALKSCNINYTPNQSYSTYTDGAMTSYTMSLSFMELTPIYEDDYEEGATEESLNSGESFPVAIGF